MTLADCRPVTLAEALRDPNLFGRFFRGKSWRAWHVFLRALFAEAKPSERDLAIYHARTGRKRWPTTAFTEAVLIVGRRGGKSRTLALIAVYLACFRNYEAFLAPGEVATIAVLAADRSQARAIFRFVAGLLKAVPLLQPMIVRQDAEQIVLSNRVVIEITTASFRSTRGYSYAAVLCDEVAFWRSDEASANPDVEILRALRPGLASIPGSMLLIASSPYAKRGELYSAFRRHYGKDDTRVLVWKASTAEMNPSIDPAIIKEAYEVDPEAAQAEYGAQFRDDLADFVTREVIDAVTMWGRHELPPEPGIIYFAFCDPSGGISDAMTLAIGHLDRNEVCILDVVLDIRPPFDPEKAVARCAELLRRYKVTTIIGDRYAGEWPKARFAEHGIEFQQSARPKSDLYRDLLPLLNARRVELLDIPRLSAELCCLERRTARGGRDSIDHVPGSHDDVANAVAGLLVGLDLDRRPPLVKVSGIVKEAPQWPAWLQYVFATVCIVGPDVGVGYFGSVRDDLALGVRNELHLLDVEALYFRPGLFADIVKRLRELAAQLHTPWATIYAPAPLVGEIAAFGIRAEALVNDFDAEEHLLFAAHCAAEGLLRFSPAVTAKLESKTIAAALELKAGDEVEGALRAALITGLAIRYDLELAKHSFRRARHA
jgi:hypothetical protein